MLRGEASSSLSMSGIVSLERTLSGVLLTNVSIVVVVAWVVGLEGRGARTRTLDWVCVDIVVKARVRGRFLA